MIKNPESAESLQNHLEIDRSRLGYQDRRFGANRVIGFSGISYAHLQLTESIMGEMAIPAQSGRIYIHPETGFAVGLDTRRKYHALEELVCRWATTQEEFTNELVADAVYNLAFPSHTPDHDQAFPGEMITSGFQCIAEARKQYRLPFAV